MLVFVAFATLIRLRPADSVNHWTALPPEPVMKFSAASEISTASFTIICTASCNSTKRQLVSRQGPTCISTQVWHRRGTGVALSPRSSCGISKAGGQHLNTNTASKTRPIHTRQSQHAPTHAPLPHPQRHRTAHTIRKLFSGGQKQNTRAGKLTIKSQRQTSSSSPAHTATTIRRSISPCAPFPRAPPPQPDGLSGRAHVIAPSLTCVSQGVIRHHPGTEKLPSRKG